MARDLLNRSAMKPVFSTVDRLGETLAFHRERHQVLAGNVANVDTPGYRPHDLVAARAPADGGVAMTHTHAAHLDEGGAAGSPRVMEDPSAEPGADGNAVDLERELAKVDANRVRYAATAELASRRLGLLRYAATDGR